MDITSMTDTELKALAYDQVKNLNMAQNNITINKLTGTVNFAATVETSVVFILFN